MPDNRPSRFFDALGRRVAWAGVDTPAAWAIAAGIIAAAGFAKPLLDALAGAPVPPYITFYPAVVVAALFGGPRIGLATALLTLVIAWWFFLPDHGSFSISGQNTPLTLIIYSLTSTFLGCVVGIARLMFDAAVASQEERDYAARESVHRIKNLLAVVQAIVSKVYREVESTAQYRDVLSDRLEALAIAQSVLVEREWDDVALGQVVDSALAPFLPNPGLKVVRGPDATVPARCVSGLCMALYELSTNAAKYGALAEGRGPVVLGWRLEAAEVILEWNEGTQAEPDRRESFGTKLIRAALDSEPTGHVEYKMDANGIYACFRWRGGSSV